MGSLNPGAVLKGGAKSTILPASELGVTSPVSLVTNCQPALAVVFKAKA